MNAAGSKEQRRVTAVIIGGGQAGLATSRELSLRGIDHIVLERGEVANSWRRERWDSLRLLTPNWQTALPGFSYAGDDPDGFQSAADVAAFLGTYAGFCHAPVRTHTCVTSVAPIDIGNEYCVQTNRGHWRCRAVVLASGPYNVPQVPGIAAALPAHIKQLNPHQYHNPEQLTAGGVLVVGASATGVQIAAEVQRSGRQVTLAVGEHIRLPRTYRGRDIQYWMHVTGLLDQGYRDVDDILRVRGLPSPQLCGHPGGPRDEVDLGLNALSQRGVNIVGRLVGMQGSHAQFSGSLANVTRMADLKQQRLLRSIDAWIEQCAAHPQPDIACSPEPTRIASPARLTLDLAGAGIGTVIWATGFRPDYSWLRIPILDRKGRLCHDGGITPAPGVYAMGLPFMRKRKSAFLFGVGDDASAIARHLATYIHARYCSALVDVAPSARVRESIGRYTVGSAQRPECLLQD